MGMFDRLHCHHPLPFPEEMDEALRSSLQSAEYQTKDLHCVLDRYEIRADGSLWVWARPRGDEADIGEAHWVPAVSVLSWVSFYGTLGKECTGWVEFRAAFVDGRLHRPIELVTYRPIDPVEEEVRRKRWDEWVAGLTQEETP